MDIANIVGHLGISTIEKMSEHFEYTMVTYRKYWVLCHAVMNRPKHNLYTLYNMYFYKKHKDYLETRTNTPNNIHALYMLILCS